MAYPAKDLRIALPSNGTATPGTPARVTYDLVAQHFGAGFNGPLIVSATIVGSDDPLGVMDGMADQLRVLPGVASVPLATPNADADTGIIQVIPEGAPDSEQTKQLVRDIRTLEPHFKNEYGVDTAVTGFTAVGIDISDRLGAALLPFGILVVGLSLVLLTMVFRSIAVPIKATVGYLLSVGAAFGVTAMVFEYGWFGSIFNVDQTAPVISFLPILLMGILFGLAMDYEVFLVSRMREEYVHGMRSVYEGGRPPTPPAGVPLAGARETRAVYEGGRPPTPPAGVPLAGARETRAGGPSRAVARAAVEDGFVASSRVVVAAAVIMLSVFGAFVPEGDGAIKTIGFGLAVGVFVDAFIVRMTLVPAVLTLLGTRAWWLPRWIDRRLPSFDVEGEGLTHQVALVDWPTSEDRHLVVAEGLRVGAWDDVAPSVLPGEVLVVEGSTPSEGTALLLTLSGRMRLRAAAPGRTVRAKTAGFVLPEQAGRVRRRTAYVDCSSVDLPRVLAALTRARPAVLFLDRVDGVTDPDARAALARTLDAVAAEGTSAVVLTVADRAALETLLRGPSRVLDLRARPALAQA
jgi:putative drug exporter of the RND superfamily